MNTAESLKQEFGTQTPELFEVGKKYLNIKTKYVMNRKAARGELPFKTFKMNNSNKSPYLVDVVELAKYIDINNQAEFKQDATNSPRFKQRKLVCGVGINDADYAICRMVDGKKERCPYYKKWVYMIERCYGNGHDSYKDCYVCDEWLRFSNFKSWMEKQDWKYKELDKDLKNPGAKLYSPENCMFLPKYINRLFKRSTKKESGLIRGVYWKKDREKFYAQNMDNGKKIFLGSFDSEKDAVKAYWDFREKVLQKIASKVSDFSIRDLINNYIEYERNIYEYF